MENSVQEKSLILSQKYQTKIYWQKIGLSYKEISQQWGYVNRTGAASKLRVLPPGKTIELQDGGNANMKPQRKILLPCYMYMYKLRQQGFNFQCGAGTCLTWRSFTLDHSYDKFIMLLETRHHDGGKGLDVHCRPSEKF